MCVVSMCRFGMRSISISRLVCNQSECCRLTCYIRLADYMVIDSLVFLNMTSLKQLSEVTLSFAAPQL